MVLWEDDLVIQAKVSPADVSFLKPGLDVRVKMDANSAAVLMRSLKFSPE